METRDQQRGGWRGRLGFLLVAIVFALVVGGYCVLRFGRVHGEEFSAQTFERRSFFYVEIPVVNLQITPIRRADQTGALAEHLVKKNIVPTAVNAKQRWDLVVAYNGLKVTARGDANILCQYFDLTEENGDIVWLEWTKKHPKASQVLWPIVAKLADQELYFFVPELLDLAADPSANSADLQAQIHRHLARRYCELAATQLQLGRGESAVELYSSALEYAPDDIQVLRGRAGAYKETGAIDAERTDLESARSLELESPATAEKPLP